MRGALGQAATEGESDVNLLDWRMRNLLRRSGLPDMPEVRKLMRASWWNGFTFGAAYRDELPVLREQALAAVAMQAGRRSGS
jgi:hypothetical protein